MMESSAMESSMDLWKPVRTVKIKVYKYNPRKDFAPGWKEYEIEVSRGTTILDALLRIKEEIDPSLAFRYSCGQALCGSCAMMVNGRQMLICRTRVLEVVKDGRIELRPLDNFPIIRDLACDFKSFFDKHRAIKPWIIRKDVEELENPTGDYKQTIEEYARYYQFTDCLMCGACYSACPTVATDHEYLGPQALSQAYRYIIDTRDDGLKERIAVVDSDHGCWRCHFATSCSDVCPKYVDPAQGIQLLKKLILRSKLGFKSHKPAEVLPSKIGEVKRG